MKLMMISLLLITTVIYVACDNGNTRGRSMQDSTFANNLGVGTASENNAPPGNKRTFDAAMRDMLRDMQAVELTGDADIDFAMLTKLHHDGAIEMSNMEIAEGNSQELKELAQKIIENSRKDNAAFETFLKQHKASSKSQFSQLAMAMLKNADIVSATNINPEIDHQFVLMMVKHHEQGIDMANQYLQWARQPVVKNIASNIVKESRLDKATLSKWKEENTAGGGKEAQR